VNPETVLVALVVSVIAPSVLAWLTGRQRQADKAQDWAREDAVAAQAAKAAKLLLDRQEADARKREEAAALLLEANERVARTAETTNTKLDVIHTLVNSNMTAAMQSELDSTVRELAALKEIIALKAAAGDKPSPEALAAITYTEAKIGELTATLNDRQEAAAVVADQEAEGAAKAADGA